MGIRETEIKIKDNIFNGKFTEVFFIQCLRVINCSVLRLSDA
ncbi:DUF6471 domain-containing protein [Niveispirillum sp.]